jgi:hypothetical protein
VSAADVVGEEFEKEEGDFRIPGDCLKIISCDDALDSIGVESDVEAIDSCAEFCDVALSRRFEEYSRRSLTGRAIIVSCCSF